MVVVLYVLGVSSIKEFAAPLMVGIACGSVYIRLHHGRAVVCYEDAY